MATATRSRKSSKSSKRGPNPQTEARKAEVELAAAAVNSDEPDFELFMARWGSRYNENNLRRLWVQAPNATCLHKFGTWRGMGRQVRKGESAIWLVQPRTHFDEDAISPLNPEGKVFTGASWMALFDYSQTSDLDAFEEDLDAAPDALAEVKRLRNVARSLHPDTTGEATEAKFIAAWAAYEAARDALKAERQAA